MRARFRTRYFDAFLNLRLTPPQLAPHAASTCASRRLNLRLTPPHATQLNLSCVLNCELCRRSARPRNERLPRNAQRHIQRCEGDRDPTCESFHGPREPPLGIFKALVKTLWPAVTLTCALTGCAHAPSPLVPSLEGAIGAPAHGVLTRGVELSRDTPGVRWLRNDDRHWAVPRLTEA